MEEYDYDANGNRTSLRKRDARIIAYQYDNLDRQWLKNIPDSTTLDVYTDYDLAGRPLYARFGSASGAGVVYGYDTAKRLETEASYGRTLTFAYDAAGNRIRLTYPDAHYIEFDPDSLNRIWKIRENGATTGVGVLATITWDPFSRRDYSTRGNGTSTDYGYDAASRLNALTQDLASTGKDLSRTFTHNAAGQIRTRNSTGAVYDWTAPLAYKTYSPDGLNRYSGGAFNYDANGNLTSDGPRTFEYDVENRLTHVNNAGVHTDLTYDPLGRLYSTVSGSSNTQFLYDGDRLVAEYGSSGLAHRYVHGPGVDEPIVWYTGAGTTSRQWLHSDERGSVVAVSDSGGNGTEYPYGPYGEPVSWTGSRFRYTGQIALPEVQLYHYKARVYAPDLGRFLQTDPTGYQDDANLYAYVLNDPFNRVDPTGMEGEPLRRPYIRKAVRAEVERVAPRAPDGRPIDPNLKTPVDGKPDLGHKTGHEFRTEKATAEAAGATQKQFNETMNDPSKYQLEDPSSNRSHKFEAKSSSGLRPAARALGAASTVIGLPGAINENVKNPQMSEAEFLARGTGIYELAVELGILPPPPPET